MLLLYKLYNAKIVFAAPKIIGITSSKLNMAPRKYNNTRVQRSSKQC